jgi:transposase-like protein
MPSEILPLPRDDRIPGTLIEFLRRFSTEKACARFLRRWKYPRGFRCPHCGHDHAWYVRTRHLDECSRCGHQTSLTAGTVMHGSRKPLRLWFAAIYLFVVSKQGISAKSLERQIDVSYPTAWTWLHKLRDAVSQRSTLPLRGVVELDDTWEGGLEEGAGGRPKAGNKKALVAGAIEVPPNQKGYGRLRLMHLENGSSAAIQPFIEANIEPGSTLLTDDWRSYRRPASECGLDHQATNVSKSEHKAHHILPAIHRVFSLLHRVLLTTYQGAVRHKHLQRYLEEFEFRFNRRTAGSRGLLFQRALSAATLGKPPPYSQIVRQPDPSTSPGWAA